MTERSYISPLSRRTEVQLAIAIRGCLPGSVKVSVRRSSGVQRGMVIVSYAQATDPAYPERKPMRRWFKLSGAWLGDGDDPKRAERIASILIEAQAVVDAKRASVLGYELPPAEREPK